MKRLAVILCVLVVVVVAFWIGLMFNFPGARASRYVEQRVNQRQAFDLVLAPAELRWFGLYVPSAELRRRDNPAAEPLVTVTDFTVPLSWRLVSGLPMHANVGGRGEVEAYLPWSLGGTATVAGQVDLGTLPVPAVLKPLALAGHLEVHGHFLMDAQSQAGVRLPEGTLAGSGRNLVVSQVRLGATPLPPTRLESLEWELETGRTVNVKRFDYRGDLQGTVAGTITPNLRNPRNSLLALRITTALRDDWLAQLGDLRPIVESFLNRGRVVTTLTGTVGRPNLQPVTGGR